LRPRIPNDLPLVKLDVQRLTQKNLLAYQKLLDAQNVTNRTRQALLDASTALNLIQGQAKREDGENDIPTVIYQDEEVPTTSPSKPTGSNTPPSPPLAPPPPLPCPPPKADGRPSAKQVKFQQTKLWRTDDVLMTNNALIVAKPDMQEPDAHLHTRI
jgi:hypothetical protein